MTDINKVLKDLGSGKVKGPSSSGRDFQNSLNFNEGALVLSGTDFKDITGTDFEHVQDILSSNFNITNDKNIRFELGKNQSKLSQFAGAVNQALVGEIIGGTIEGIGYLADLESWSNSIAQEEGTFNNYISDIGKGIREYTQEATPIFKDEEEGGFNPGEFSWWMSHAPSVASTLSLMIPSGAVIKGASYAAKGTRMAKALEGLRGTKLLLKSTGHAVLSRHGENMMEASGIYDQKYKEALAKGYDADKANEIAAKGAAFVYNANWAMLAQDIIQSYMLFKTGAPVTKGPTAKMAKELGISKLEAAAKKFGKYGLQHGSEALEEGYQYVIGKEGERISNEAMGITDNRDFSDRLKDYMDDGEFYSSMFFGALGSAVTQGVSNLIQGKALSEEQKARLEQVQNRGSVIAHYGKKLNQAIEEGASDILIEDIKEEMAVELGITAAEVGNYEFQKEYMESLLELSAEEKAELNLQTLDNAALSSIIEKMDYAVKDYAKNRIKYEGATVKYITKLKSLSKLTADRIDRSKKSYDNILNKIPKQDKLSENGRDLLSKKAELKAAKHLANIFDKRAKAKGATEADVKADTALRDRFNKKADELESTVKNYKIYYGEGGITKEDLEIINNEAFTNDLIGPKVSELANNERFDSYTEALKKAQSPEFQKEAKEKREKFKKEYRESVKNTLTGIFKRNKKDKEIAKEEEAVKSAENTSEKVKETKKQKKAEKKAETQPPKKEGKKETPKEPSATGGMRFDEKGRPIPVGRNKFVSAEEQMAGKTTEAPKPTTPQEKAEEIVAEAHETASKAKDSSEVLQTVSAEETEEEQINEFQYLVTSGYDLAWISAGSPSENLSKKEKEQHRELSEFIENPDTKITDYSVVYSIDVNNKEQKNSEALQAYRDYKEGKIESIDEDVLGYLPVKAEIVRTSDNSVITDSNGNPFTIHIHDIDFDFADEHKADAIRQVKNLKKQILEGDLNNIQYFANLESKQGGHLVPSEEANNLGELLSNVTERKFYVGNKNNELMDHTGETALEFLATTATPGAIYIEGQKANGQPFPFRTMSSNLTEEEAYFVLGLFTMALQNPSMLNKPIPKGLIQKINNSPEIISKLPINRGKITLSELIDEFVFQGEKFTKHKGKHALYMKNGMLHIGGKQIASEDILGKHKEFTMEVMRNKNRQVNRKSLGNKNYRQYLVNNNILKGKFGITEYGMNFVQSTVRAGELQELTNKPTKEVKKDTKPTEKTQASKAVDKAISPSVMPQSDIEAAEDYIAQEIGKILSSNELYKTINEFSNTNLGNDGKLDMLLADLDDIVQNWGIDKESVAEYMQQQGTTLVKSVWQKHNKEFFEVLKLLKEGNKVSAESSTSEIDVKIAKIEDSIQDLQDLIDSAESAKDIALAELEEQEKASASQVPALATPSFSVISPDEISSGKFTQRKVGDERSLYHVAELPDGNYQITFNENANTTLAFNSPDIFFKGAPFDELNKRNPGQSFYLVKPAIVDKSGKVIERGKLDVHNDNTRVYNELRAETLDLSKEKEAVIEQYEKDVKLYSETIESSRKSLDRYKEDRKAEIESLKASSKKPEIKSANDQITYTPPTPEVDLSEYKEEKPVKEETKEGKKEESTIVESKPSMTGLTYNKEQQEAIDKMFDFLTNKDNKLDTFSLIGKAGTGKTTIMKEVLMQHLAAGGSKRIVVAALSNKAKQVISNSLGSDVPHEAYSIAGLLGMRMDKETGEFTVPDFKNSEEEKVPPIWSADVVIVDESSMVNESALEAILEYKKKGAKIIFAGDKGQLPPIRKPKDKNEGKDSPVFDITNNSQLLVRVRQGEESPILPYADHYWNNSDKESGHVFDPISSRKNIITDEGLLVFPKSTSAINIAIEEFKKGIANKDNNVVKVVTYTNRNRQSINKHIHKNIFGKDAKFITKGAPMIFNDGFVDEIKKVSYDNSSEFFIDEIKNEKVVEGVPVVEIVAIDAVTGDKFDLTIPNIDKQGDEIYQDKVSEKFNYAKSLPKGGQRSSAFRETFKFKDAFPSVDLAYAITSHKSQGSTYNTVIVNENDIMGVGPTSNKSKSQSMYTAITRAKNNVLIISERAEDKIDEVNLIQPVVKADSIPTDKDVKKSEVEEIEEDEDEDDDALQIISSRGKRQPQPGVSYEEVEDEDEVEQPVNSRGEKTFNPKENKEAKKQDTKSIEAFLKSKKKDKDGPSADTLFKFSNTPVNEDATIVNNEAEYLRTLLPEDIAIELTKDYINILRGGELVTGMFYNNVISVYNNAGKGVVYHEGFHAVFNTMLTAKERRELINESKKINGNFTQEEIAKTAARHNTTMAKAEDILHEEILADEFALFLESPEMYTFKKPKSRSLFQRLLSWITNVFSNKLTAKKLFKDIKSGAYAKRPVTLSRNMRYHFVTPQEFTEDEFDEVTNQLAFVSYQRVNTPETVEDLIDKEYLQTFLANSYQEAIGKGDEELATKYNNVFQNIDAFIGSLENFFGLLGIKSLKKLNKKGEQNLDEESKEAEADDTGIVPFDKFNKSSKDSANNTTKLMIALLPELNSTELVNGRLDYDTKGTYLGLPRFASFGQSWRLLKNVTKDIVPYVKKGEYVETYGQMYDAIKALSIDFPRFQVLLNTLDKTNVHARQGFTAAMAEHLYDFETALINATKTKTEVQFTSSNNASNNKAIRNDWSNNFINKFTKMSEDGTKIYDKDKIDKVVIDEYSEVAKTVKKEIQEQLKSGKENKAVYDKAYKGFKDALRSIGITISDKAFNRLIDNHYAQLVNDGRLKEAGVANRTVALYDFMASGKVRFMFNELLNSANKPVSRNRTGTDILSLIQNENVVLYMADVESYFSSNGSDANSLGPDGKSYYNYDKHNGITLSLAQWKNSPEMLDEILSTPWGRKSVWERSIKNGNFSVTAPINIKQENSDDVGRKVSELSEKDLIFTVFNSYLQGRFVGLAEADKSTQFWFKGPQVVDAEVSSAGYYDNGKLSVNFQDTGLADNATSVLEGYLYSELGRMKKVWLDLYGLNPLAKENLVDNLHTVGKDGKIKGLQSHLFNTEKLKELGLIGDEVDKGVPGMPFQITLEELVNNKEVTKYVQESLEKLINKDLEKLVSAGIFEAKGNVLIPRGVDNEVVSKYRKRALDNGYSGIEATHYASVYMVADFSLNSIIANVETTKLFTGDPAIFKADKAGDMFADFNKRIPLINAGGTLASPVRDENGEWLARPYFNSATLNDINKYSDYMLNDENVGHIADIFGMSEQEIRELYSPYGEIKDDAKKRNIETTDAQAFITPEFYRERMIAYGKWSFNGENSHESIHNKLIKGEPVSTIQLKKLLAQALKVVHAETKVQDGNLVTHYNKQSEFPLYPNITKGTDLENLRQAMYNNKVDHVIFGSGKKAGASGKADIVDANNNILSAEEIKLYPQKLSTVRSFLQQDLSAKGTKDSALVGSQVEKNVVANVPLDKDIVYLVGNEEYSPMEILSEYHKTVSAISDYGLQKFYDVLKSEDEDTINKDGLYAYVKEELKDELDDGQKEALDRGVPFKAIPGLGVKLEQKILSLLKANTVNLTHNGGAAIQVSGVGMNSNRFTDMDSKDKESITWLRSKQYLKPPVIKEINGEKVVTYAEILLPYKFIKNIPGHQEMSPNELIKKIDPAILEGVMYRIPNQGPSSSDAFKIVGFLPETAGDSIVTYDEVTTKTGADFDIDKLFYMVPYVYYSEELGKLVKSTKGLEGLKNKRLDLMKALISHPENYVNLTSPLDNDRLSDMAKELFSDTTEMEELDFFGAFTQMTNKVQFDNAKALVGSIANYMTTHSIGQFNGLKLTEPVIIAGKPYDRLFTMKDEEGNFISSTLNDYMNAIVDAAKDPYISRMNVNFMTADTLFSMLSLGVNRELAALFIGSPVIRELVKKTKERESRFIETESEYRTAYNEIEFMLMSQYPEKFDENGSFIFDSFVTELDEERVIELLKQDIKTNTLNPEVFYKFIELQQMGKNVGKAIKATKATVNGAGKSAIEANAYMNNMIDLKESNYFSTLDGFLGYEDDLYFYDTEENFVGSYIRNSVMEVVDSLAPSLDINLDEVNRLAKIFGDSKGTNLNLHTVLSREVTAVKLSRPGSPLRVSKEKYNELFFGSNSIHNRINSIKFNPEHPLYRNKLINQLRTTQGNKEKPSFVSVNNGNKKDSIEKRSLKRAWLEIYNKDAQLGKDLLLYTFNTSNFNFNSTSLVDFIPSQILEDMDYYKYTLSEEYQEEITYSELSQIAKNNTDNKHIFRTVPNTYKVVKGEKTVSVENLQALSIGKKGNRKGLVSVVNSQLLNELFLGYSSEGAEYRRFIKTRSGEGFNYYELVGTTKPESTQQFFEEKALPIYRLVDAMGFADRGNVTKEYGISEDTNIPFNKKSGEESDKLKENISKLKGEDSIVREFVDLAGLDVESLVNTEQVKLTPEQVKEYIKKCK